MRIQVAADASQVSYTVDNRAVSTVNISDYQHGDSVSQDEIFVGSQSVAIRLGRENDMFMITAFRNEGTNICSKHLFVRLRDGRDIGLEFTGDEGNRDLYGVRYGRNGDLFNIYGYRFQDNEFVFDPRAPRTGRNRNPNMVIRAGGVADHDVIDGGCR